MTSIGGLIDDLRSRGVSLWLDADQIRMRGPLSACASELDELKRRKDEAVDHLRAWREMALFANGMTGPRTRSTIPEVEVQLIEAAADKAFAAVGRDDFHAMLELDRFTQRSESFDRLIASGEDHFWNPLDSRYLDLSAPFDIETQVMIAEAEFLCLKAPSVRERLPDRRSRVRFINRIVWIRFSTLLHGEQGALSLSASLCGVLKDQAAQEFAANQAREEARHVTAFSRYIKARWGRPAPCLPALRDFLAEIVRSSDVTKKIIGMQVMVEGLAMGSLGSLHKRLLDQAGRRLIQLVMTDESFHHRFGKMWAERTLPSLVERDRERLQAWTAHCLRDFIVKMNPPLELYLLKQEFGLDPLQVSREMRALGAGERPGGTAIGSEEIFRVLTQTLMKAGLLSEESRELYGLHLADGDGDFAELGYDRIVEEGLAFLQGVKDASGRAFMA